MSHIITSKTDHVNKKRERNVMQRKLLLLLRISRPEYNKTLYEEYRIFMNLQKNFRRKGLNKGQYDEFEGAILKGPCDFVYHAGEEMKQVHLDENGIIYKENDAYIFCMYAVVFDISKYNEENNKFYHNISWDYIKPLWDNGGSEMIIIKNTKKFLDKFHTASEKVDRRHAQAMVKYDLRDRLQDKEYFEQALQDDFEAIYHKMDTYKAQKEYRLSLIDSSSKDFIILELENDQNLLFDVFSLEYGKDIVIEISDLEFNSKTNLPDRFSSKLKFFESKETIEKKPTK